MSAAERLGANLRKARDAGGLSQEELAFRAGIHPKMISQYENGHMHPRPGTLVKLAEACGVSSDELRGVDQAGPREALTIATAQFGSNVKEFRWRAGLSQFELGEGTGMHRTSIQKIEYGARSVRLMTLLALADVLAVDPCELLRGLRP